jgi:hypothetical protein
MIQISPEKMTVEEKFLSMEIIWQDLCEHSDIDSPNWHKQVLDLRSKKVLSGQQKPMDIRKAKQQILNKISE